MAVTSDLGGRIIEYCIGEGILTTPESPLCAEGVLMLVEK
jgi:hypothetical protein